MSNKFISSGYIDLNDNDNKTDDNPTIITQKSIDNDYGKFEH